MASSAARMSLMITCGSAPSTTAPSASSGSHGTPILRTSTMSSGASSPSAISKPTGTPPRGKASTTGFCSRNCCSRAASWRPADLLLGNMAQLSSCLGTYIFGRNSATAIVAEPGRQSHASRERYDKDVYNGDLGVVLRIDMEESELTVDFDSREVVYGFGE